MERFECHCKRCDWVWFSREEHPVSCAKCKSPYWDRLPILKTKAEVGIDGTETSAFDKVKPDVFLQ